MTRIKRSQRIVEKVARRLVDSIFDRIREGAGDLAEERAVRQKYMPETIEQLHWELFMPHALTLDAVDLEDAPEAGEATQC